MASAINMCFTINNWTQEHCEGLKQLCNKTKTLLSMRVQSEIGKEGTPHLQGMCCFTKAQAFEKVYEWLGFRNFYLVKCHHPTAQWKYCGPDKQTDKQETITSDFYYEYGVPPPPKSQGQRNDIHEFRDAINEGKSDYELNLLFPNECMKYTRYIVFCRKALAEQKAKERYMEMPEVHIIHGDAGSGKTSSVFKQENPDDVYMMPEQNSGTLWLDDSFRNQEVVLIDDFDDQVIAYKSLIKMCDRYSPMIQTKGGFVKFHPKKIYITSNKHPNEWYSYLNTRERNSINRRIKSITEKNVC